MVRNPDRRQVLAAGLGGLAAAALPCAALAQAGAGLEATWLADGLLLVRGAGGNVVARMTPDRLVLVDGGSAERSGALLDLLAQETGTSRISTLINTHWHPDQTGSNVALGEAGVKIVAHENTRLWMTTDVRPPYEDRVYEPMPDIGRPTETFYQTYAVPLGDGEAELGYLLQAHTDGDIYVRFPDANVIVAGGALKTDGWAEIDWWTGGWIGSGVGGQRARDAERLPSYGGMVGGLQALHEMADDDTVIVPADGAPVGRAELAEQIEIYAGVADVLRAMMYDGRGPGEVVAAAPAAGARPEWGSPDDFVVRAFKSMWPHLTPDA